MKNDEAIANEVNEPKPQLDLSFKEGETIKINMKIVSTLLNFHVITIFVDINIFELQKRDGNEGASSRTGKKTGGLGGILPPPPKAEKTSPSNDFGDFVQAPSSQSSSTQQANSNWVQF